MEIELLALDKNQTWDIVSCLPSVKPLGNKFVFSIKNRLGGPVDCYKAGLIVLANKQEYGLNYDKTFALVAKMTTMHTIIALAALQSWSLHQMDVKNAFLHGDLMEEVYIKLSYGMHTPSPYTICKLKHSLYGLKQAPRVWFEKFRSTIIGFSFTQIQYDPSLFFQRTLKGIMVLVYVDDIVMTSSDQNAFSKLKQILHSTFHMKQLGNLPYFLGLELAGLTNSTPIDTSLEVNVKYRREEGEILDYSTIYCKQLDNLIYVTITRLDISIVVHIQYNESLDISLTPQSVVYFFSIDSSLNLQAYSDADWVDCPNKRKSTTS
ncbi:hypothetical protein CR513_57595, partial [Mucuna pruriens]